MAKKEKVDADVFYNVCDKCKKLDNNLTDGSNSMEDIINNSDNFYGYLTQ